MAIPDESTQAGQQPVASLWRDTLSAQAEFSTGFDGVLLFVAVNRVLSPAFAVYALYLNLAVFIQPPIWHAFINSGYPDFYWKVAVVTLSGAAGGSISLLFDLILLWLFFRRRRAFRSAIIAFYFLNIGLPFGILALSFMFGELNTDEMFFFGIAVLWALLWVPYFIYSHRVKNTFVR